MNTKEMLYVLWKKVKENKVVVEIKHSANYTIAQKATMEVSINVAKTGYRVIGVRSISANSAAVIPYFYWVNGPETGETDISVGIWNGGTGSVTQKVSVAVVYQKI